VPYIHDCGALLTYMMIAYHLANSEPTELTSRKSRRLIPDPPDIRGCQARESHAVSWGSARFDGPSGPESIAFLGRPIPPVVFTRPTKRWPCGVTGLWPHARTFRLLVDPRDICPTHTPYKKSEVRHSIIPYVLLVAGCIAWKSKIAKCCV
jgi:hypothetical protein